MATPLLIEAIGAGFTGAKRDLTISIVRVLFPGAGLLVASAWCLGILNSHRRFLLSYTAPVLWNAAMIAALLAFGARESLPRLAVILAWGPVVGSALPLGVQLPASVASCPISDWSSALQVLGDWAIERVTWTLELQSTGGGVPAKDNGKGLHIWRREGQTWRVAQAIWNSDNPMPSTIWSGTTAATT